LANVTGFVSVRLEKTLITPFFWPTKIRPSGANCATVGLVIPLSTTVSRNPFGSTDASAARLSPANDVTRSNASVTTTTRRIAADRGRSMPTPHFGRGTWRNLMMHTIRGGHRARHTIRRTRTYPAGIA
jgi:hypothetical protein